MSEMIDAIELGDKLIKEGYGENNLFLTLDDALILLEKNKASLKISLDETMRLYNAIRDAYLMGFGRGFNKGCDFGKFHPELIDED